MNLSNTTKSFNDDTLRDLIQSQLPTAELQVVGQIGQDVNRNVPKNLQPHLKENAEKVFEKLFTDLNAKYNLEVKIDFKDFSSMLSNMINPKNKRAIELYITEAFSRFRVVIYLRMMQSIHVLSEHVLDPAQLLSESTTYQEKFDMLDKLFKFMQQIEEIYEQVNINASDLELEKLGDTTTDLDESDAKVIDFLEQLKDKHTKRPDEELDVPEDL